MGHPLASNLINATTPVAVVRVDVTTKPVAVTNSAANFTVSATATPTPAGDTVKLDVSFTVPSAGAMLLPNTQILLTAIANDNVAVQEFTFTNGLTGPLLVQEPRTDLLTRFPTRRPALPARSRWWGLLPTRQATASRLQ
jgi:hypothetical protein